MNSLYAKNFNEFIIKIAFSLTQRFIRLNEYIMPCLVRLKVLVNITLLKLINRNSVLQTGLYTRFEQKTILPYHSNFIRFYQKFVGGQSMSIHLYLQRKWKPAGVGECAKRRRRN